MSKALERELLEVAQWYCYHKDTDMPIEKRLEFLTKAMDFLIWTLAKSVEDIRVLEGRRETHGSLIEDPYILRALPNSLKRNNGTR